MLITLVRRQQALLKKLLDVWEKLWPMLREIEMLGLPLLIVCEEEIKSLREMGILE